MVVLVSGLIFFLLGVARPKGAGILIKTNPQSSIFIEGELLGRTPYEEIRRPGEITIKLVPESFDMPLAPYETKVNLVSGVQTVIVWEFGESSEYASGEIVSFEKIGKDETALSAVTIPASSSVDVDGGMKVFTPYKTSSIAPGEHTLIFSSKGFIERPLRVKTVNGYKLTAVVQLARSTELTEEAVSEVKNEEVKKIEVEILTTPVGFLRVRSEPSTIAEEIGQVEPGKRYSLVEEDDETGWYKIEFMTEGIEETKIGWVSNTYAKKIEGESNESPTQTVKATPKPSI